MVSREDNDRMITFITERLEDSGVYKINKRNNFHILVAEKPEIREVPAIIYVAAHNDPGETVDHLKRGQSQNLAQGIYTAHVFYKDGETFMVRLGARGRTKNNERSLKRYPPVEVNSMVHLRGLEKAVLDHAPQELAYYQPKSDRLPESVRVFLMKNVNLDYSHIRPGDPGYSFARDAVSKDYKLPVEQSVMTLEPAQLLLIGAQKRALIRPYN